MSSTVEFSFEPITNNNPKKGLGSDRGVGGSVRGGVRRPYAVDLGDNLAQHAASGGLSARQPSGVGVDMRTRKLSPFGGNVDDDVVDYDDGGGGVVGGGDDGMRGSRTGAQSRGVGTVSRGGGGDSVLQNFLRHVDRDRDRREQSSRGSGNKSHRPTSARSAADGQSATHHTQRTLHQHSQRAGSARGPSRTTSTNIMVDTHTRTSLPTGGAHVRRIVGAHTAKNGRPTGSQGGGGGRGNGDDGGGNSGGMHSVPYVHTRSHPSTVSAWVKTLSGSGGRAPLASSSFGGPQRAAGSPYVTFSGAVARGDDGYDNDECNNSDELDKQEVAIIGGKHCAKATSATESERHLNSRVASRRPQFSGGDGLHPPTRPTSAIPARRRERLDGTSTGVPTGRPTSARLATTADYHTDHQPEEDKYVVASGSEHHTSTPGNLLTESSGRVDSVPSTSLRPSSARPASARPTSARPTSSGTSCSKPVSIRPGSDSGFAASVPGMPTGFGDEALWEEDEALWEADEGGGDDHDHNEWGGDGGGVSADKHLGRSSSGGGGIGIGARRGSGKGAARETSATLDDGDVDEDAFFWPVEVAMPLPPTHQREWSVGSGGHRTAHRPNHFQGSRLHAQHHTGTAARPAEYHLASTMQPAATARSEAQYTSEGAVAMSALAGSTQARATGMEGAGGGAGVRSGMKTASATTRGIPVAAAALSAAVFAAGDLERVVDDDSAATPLRRHSSETSKNFRRGTTAATPAYAASLISTAAGDIPETTLPEDYHVYDLDIPRESLRGCAVRDGVLVFDSDAACRSVSDYRLFPRPGGGSKGNVDRSMGGGVHIGVGGGDESGGGDRERETGGRKGGRSRAWEAVQLAWTCDLMSADVLKTLDPLKLPAVSSSAKDSASVSAASCVELPDVKTLLDYSPEYGALRMWPEVYEKCLSEVSRLTWEECPERAAVLERLRVRTSRLFVFAHRLVASYRRRLEDATEAHQAESRRKAEARSKRGGGGGAAGVATVSELHEELDEALDTLAAERAARVAAVAQVESLEAELRRFRTPMRVPSTLNT